MKPDAAGGSANFDPSSMPGMENLQAMLGPGFMIALAIMLALFIFGIFLQWKIFSKAGYPGALALTQILLVIPLINLIGIFVVAGIWIWFAFADWPVLKKARGDAALMKT